MIDIDNQTNHKLHVEKIKQIYDALTHRDLELIFTDDEGIRVLNKNHRGKDKPTDVLSFPLLDMPHSPLGSIIINIDKAISVSEDLGHSLENELCLLFIHGFLHVSGYDHENDNGQMREKEKELIESFSLPKSLIVRTQG
ncbi:MAG: rRNA maturation RNase YbeY [Campylobacteraceae bacterium]|nr:rRNA maturation RNase YbeY [Campylobacteraceae bacterium]